MATQLSEFQLSQGRSCWRGIRLGNERRGDGDHKEQAFDVPETTVLSKHWTGGGGLGKVGGLLAVAGGRNLSMRARREREVCTTSKSQRVLRLDFVGGPFFFLSRSFFCASFAGWLRSARYPRESPMSGAAQRAQDAVGLGGNAAKEKWVGVRHDARMPVACGTALSRRALCDGMGAFAGCPGEERG